MIYIDGSSDEVTERALVLLGQVEELFPRLGLGGQRAVQRRMLRMLRRLGR